MKPPALVPLCLLAVVAVLLSCALGGRADADARAAFTIRDCDSFRAWLRQQPVAELNQGAYPDDVLAAAPAPTGGSDEFLVPAESTTYFAGRFGGKGCLGGRYDSVNRIAIIVGFADTEQEGIATTVTSVPKGLRSGSSAVRTRRGARLGMTVAEIERIEGHARHRPAPGGEVLEYRWHWSGASTGRSIIYNALTFVVRDGRVVAMDYYVGA
jgi:hypothetical protein